MVERAGIEQLDVVEPLWKSLQEHHAELEEVPDVRALDASWKRRRAQYERWLREGTAYLLVASDGDHAVGYLMLRLGDGPSTWEIGERAGEVETLAVLPEARSSGVGEALMRAAIEVADANGVRALGVGVVHSNEAAIRFYERAGFRQFYLQMLRVAD